MEQGKTSIPKLILMLVIYSTLSILGFFTQVVAVIFPVFALPFALYVIKERPPLILQSLFHVMMLVLNYFIVGHHIAILLIYTVSVIIPVGIIVFFYDQKLALPQFAMYVAISLCMIGFIFFSIMKLNGIDFEKAFIEGLDSLKILFNEATEHMIKLETSQATMTKESITSLKERQQYVLATLEAMKAFFAYTMVTMIISFSALSVILFNAILRRKDKTLPSIKQFIEFRLSKAATIIFIIAMFVASTTHSSQGVLITLALNLINVFIWLFRIAGGLGLIGLIYRSAANMGLKVLGYIGIILFFGFFPNILMIFGCLDTFFNYRKVEIVV